MSCLSWFNLPNNSFSKVVVQLSPFPRVGSPVGRRMILTYPPIRLQSALFSQRPWWVTALPHRRPCRQESMRPNHHQEGAKTSVKSTRWVLKFTGPGVIRLNQAVLCPAGTASDWHVCGNCLCSCLEFGRRLAGFRSRICLVPRTLWCNITACYLGGTATGFQYSSFWYYYISEGEFDGSNSNLKSWIFSIEITLKF